MRYEYYAWKSRSHGGFATLEALTNVEDAYEIGRGVPRSKSFPEDACFHMNPAFPKEIKLADNIKNRDLLLVVSGPLKSFIEAREPRSTEYLPITIYNHNNRVASDDYFIINPHQVIDCIDQEASDLTWNKIDPELISSCFGLVVDESRIDDSLLLFRLKYMPNVVLVREDLVEDLEGASFTGLRFVELDEFEL